MTRKITHTNLNKQTLYSIISALKHKFVGTGKIYYIFNRRVFVMTFNNISAC